MALAYSLFRISLPIQLLQAVNNEPEQVFIELAILFNPWIMGVLLSLYFSRFNRYIKCAIIVLQAPITEDFYKVYSPNASEKKGSYGSRSMVLLPLAIWIAQDENSKVLKQNSLGRVW